MSVQPCGTPAGMMMMSPTFTFRFTTSAPAIVPLHDGPFSTLVTSLSGGGLGVVLGAVGALLAARRMHIPEMLSWKAIVLPAG